MRSQKGFTLLELLVGVAIIVVSGLGVASLSMMVSDLSSESASKAAVSNTSLRLQSVVENPEAWENTVAANASGSMACLANKSDCASVAAATEYQPFILKDAKNDTVYDSTNTQHGFTLEGGSCDSFSNDSIGCPIRYELGWKAVCPPSGACLTPLVSVKSNLAVSSKLKLSASDSSASFNLLRRQAQSTVRRTCETLGGNYDSKTRECVIGQNERLCADGRMLAGVDSNHNLVCRPLYSGSCTGNEIIVGYNPANGEPICKGKKAQVPLTLPDSSIIPCQLAEKQEGQTWYSLAGEVSLIENCSDSDRKRLRVYRREAQMICKDGFIYPTGRTKDTATEKISGTCEASNSKVCASGKNLGELFWKKKDEQIETFHCFGTNGSLKRDITYNVEEQFVCTQYGDEPTGRVSKNENSRQLCPAQTVEIEKEYNIAGTGQKATGKILFVVDNSNSMQNAIDTLASGVDTFLNDLHSANIEVKVINTSAISSATGSFKWNVHYTDSAGKTITLDEANAINPTSLYYKVHHSEMKPVHKYVLSKDDGAAALTSFRNNVKQAISHGAGTSAANATNGDVNEIGLCSAVMALYDDSANKFFNKGDIGALVFLTDDDDISTWNVWNCRNYQRNKIDVTTQPVKVTYANKYYQYAYKWTQPGTLDGIPVTEHKNANANVPKNITVSEGDCSAEKFNSLKDDFAVSHPERSLYECKITSVNYNRTFDDHETNLCGSDFSMSGGQYSGMAQYFIANDTNNLNWKSNSCSRSKNSARKTAEAGESAGMSNHANGLGGPYGVTIQKAILDRSTELFGENGLYLSNIINDGSCSFTAGQSKSTKYQALATLMNAPSRSTQFPVCQNNFAGALKPLSEGIMNAINNSLLFPHKSNETIAGIEIQRAGGRIVLPKENYSIVGDRIDFINFNLASNDQVIVKVRFKIVE